MIKAFVKAGLNMLLVGLEIAGAIWLYRSSDPSPLNILAIALIAGIVAGILERSLLGLGRPWLLVPDADPDTLSLVTRRWQGRAARALRWAGYAASVAVGLLVYRSLAAGFAGIFAFEAVRELVGPPAVCWSRVL